MRTLRSAVALAHLVMIGMAVPVWSGITTEQEAGYRQLRKGFFLAIALAPAKGKRPRKEHRRYLKEATAFASQVTDSSPAYSAGAEYMKGRILLKVGKHKSGRKSLALCLAGIVRARKADEPLPPGLPSECAIRVFRAFSYFGEGNAKVLEELEAIPEGLPKPRYHEVGEPLGSWAEALETRQEDAHALRVYLLIKRWGVWEEGADDPARKIKLIRFRTEAAKPAATEDGN
ncbi:MAG: hypothetical protein HN904_03520 [Victivallales bacterium]|nr:hypothetical protein [Victivallales bacterium]